ncbi:MAG: DUF2065 domain-containing protein [Gammaproteobacteria bacterium]|nr:DUF2065 domain-containing protein [Gammaproteobacteria bacterium]MCP4091119.1 DUF2065 domain-containing protein [Gammaproteobacteria bacterium]MCP4277355.1 DUF2065 domain-containing protein [Gammaproteobacteria bacterium]MCP4831584.1 DUF2065 domain-containing protein [Gammaproteobacteria bacterium]MCP4927807.1 DUF2065 domain-containing protein [Gammaproteobacteria bacterium]
MEWTDLLAAFALYMVIEGLLPFMSPQSWKKSLEQIAKLTDRQLRIFGLGSMLAGLFLLTMVRG